MSEVITVGEPMALLVADHEGPLEDIEHFTKYVAGAEVNFSIGMTRLGHSVTYIAKLGLDPFGKYINKFLQQQNIKTPYIKFDASNRTGMQLKAKVSVGDPEVFNFRKGSAASHMDLPDVEDVVWENVRHLHLTGIPPALSATCRSVTYKLIQNARENGVSISFDPNLRLQLWEDKEEMVQIINELASQSDIVLPGVNEGLLLTGSDDENAIADFYLNKGVSTVIVKLGEKGAFVKTKVDSFIVPGFKVKKVVDTVGAGDGFAVGVISGLLEGLSLNDAVRRGNAVGALAVMSPGDNDGLPNPDQLETYMNSQNGINR
ncbi:2-keto-3-deoxygluconate kinase [Pelosinus fermentans]|uniref:PfkB domain protein n=1 Tax=Pelosinus fermentans B4 TaxID=1149862 RepID=I9LI26_9FIRM|nr:MULTISPECIES: sugar kinase [Pelosinus]EIW20169.1 PfkB domain protein [Pelosinus fermentans B4]OAM93025.1 2-dehydro-3-deoxygluconokinase [Pelosinus fermentans DSM 17108]SDQ64514.1 2-keto-3-deoxygluconate kinase [Pelosinus fermentans]